jgi:hypothetical protein
VEHLNNSVRGYRKKDVCGRGHVRVSITGGKEKGMKKERMS